MEITEGRVTLTAAEARWLTEARSQVDNEPLRLRVQRARLDFFGFTDVPEALRFDLNNIVASLQRVRAGGAMQLAENDLPRDAAGAERHVIEVDCSQDELDDIYVGSTRAKEWAEQQADKFSETVMHIPGLGKDEDAERSTEEDRFVDSLSTMQIASGIIRAIEDHKG